MLNRPHEDILNDYQLNGFVCIPQFFSKNRLTQLISGLTRVLNFIHAYPHKNNTFYFRGTRIVFEEKILHRIVWAQAMEPIFHQINLNKDYLDLIKVLLFQTTEIKKLENMKIQQIINQLHIKQPGDGVSFRFHQDAENRSYGTSMWNDRLQNGSFIQTAVALSNMTEKSGPLEFYRGSHAEGYIQLDKDNNKLKQIEGKYEKVIINAYQGDLILFHPFCIHGSHPNKSEENRSLFINGYCPIDVNAKQYPGCGKGRYLV